MSDHERVATLVRGLMPCAHMAWPTGEDPALPWAVFYAEETQGFCADGATFARARRWVVEVYERDRSEPLHRALESAVEAEFGPCDVSEWWSEGEQCLQTAYRFTSIERIPHGA